MTLNALPDQQRRSALDEIESWGYFRSVRWVDTIDSTNRFLSEQVRAGSIELPALLVATSQTSGVGRGSNKWYSPSGCLMFSFAIPIDDSDSTLLPLQFGYAVANAIEPISQVKPLIKWPNDVFIDGKKVCGILIEAIPRNDASPYNTRGVAVVGVGLNCQVDLSTAPEELQKSATSLHVEAKKLMVTQVTPEYVLIQVLQAWLEASSRNSSEPNWLMHVWQNASLLNHKWVSIRTAGGPVEGYCLGISLRGALLVVTSNNQTVEVMSGSIESYRDV
jgi:BirA family biotin operon repressor/biotin-[acetyl-CoA-carboxylase] ligase